MRLKYKRRRRQTQKAMAIPVIEIDDENVVAASGDYDVTVEANVVDDVTDTVPASADDSLDSDEEVALINDLCGEDSDCNCDDYQDEMSNLDKIFLFMRE